MLWHSTAPQCGEDMEVAATHGSIQSPGKVIDTKYYKQPFYATQSCILHGKMILTTLYRVQTGASLNKENFSNV